MATLLIENASNASDPGDGLSVDPDEDPDDEDVPDVSSMDFTSKETYYYKMIDKFFRQLSQETIRKMLAIIDGKHKISLRLMDWFVTRYAYKQKTVYKVLPEDKDEDKFNVHISYKAQLKSYKKRYFDPFRRSRKGRGKFKYLYDKENNKDLFLATTIGQLNFFRWAFKNNIVSYIENNYDAISNAMVSSNKEEKSKKSKDTSDESDSDEEDEEDDESSKDKSLTKGRGKATTKDKVKAKEEALKVSKFGVTVNAKKTVVDNTVKIRLSFN